MFTPGKLLSVSLNGNPNCHDGERKRGREREREGKRGKEMDSYGGRRKRRVGGPGESPRRQPARHFPKISKVLIAFISMVFSSVLITPGGCSIYPYLDTHKVRDQPVTCR